MGYQPIIWYLPLCITNDYDPININNLISTFKKFIKFFYKKK